MTAFHKRRLLETTSAAEPRTAEARPRKAPYFSRVKPVRKCHKPRWLPIPEAISRISAASAVISAITGSFMLFDFAMSSAPSQLTVGYEKPVYILYFTPMEGIGKIAWIWQRRPIGRLCKELMKKNIYIHFPSKRACTIQALFAFYLGSGSRPSGPLQTLKMLLAVGQRTDTHRPHHLVVLVRDDVAVPEKKSGDVELGLHACKHARVDEDGVLGPDFSSLWRRGCTAELGRSIRSDRDRLAVDYFELHLVDMNRMGVLGEIVDLPGLRGSERRVLGDGVHKLSRCWRDDPFVAHACRAEERLDRCIGDS